MSENFRKPIIIGFISNLMFSIQIESVLMEMGYQTIWIDRTEQLVMSKEVYLNRQIAEPLHGPGAELIEKLVQIQPGMILIDLDFAKIPWKDWIVWIKSAPATRRIPVICICNHVNKSAFNAAKSAGADKVVARSGIIKLLPEVVNRYIRIVDYEKLRESCEGLLSKKALRGIELFNQGEYFEAHEYLEKAWNEDASLGKELYRVILQVAVAYLQIERLNYNGVIKIFLRIQQWIDPLPAICKGVDVAQLKLDLFSVQETIKSLGKERMADFDRAHLRPIILIE